MSAYTSEARGAVVPTRFVGCRVPTGEIRNALGFAALHCVSAKARTACRSPRKCDEMAAGVALSRQLRRPATRTESASAVLSRDTIQGRRAASVHGLSEWLGGTNGPCCGPSRTCRLCKRCRPRMPVHTCRSCVRRLKISAATAVAAPVGMSWTLFGKPIALLSSCSVQIQS
jgi:hypothetical protein